MSTPPPVPPPPISPYTPPAFGGPPPPPAGDRLPWEERERLGLFEALIQTIRLVVTDPSNAFSRLRPDSDLTSPILFGLIVSWVGYVFSQGWDLAFGGLMRSIFSGIEGLERAYWAPGTAWILGTLVVWPLIFLVGLFISGGILHLCLLIVGATNESPIGFEGTLKVVAYAQVATLAGIVPLVGSLIGALWLLVLEVIGLAQVHRTTQGRALLAVLIPVLFCCACILVGVALFGAMIAAFISAMMGGSVSP